MSKLGKQIYGNVSDNSHKYFKAIEAKNHGERLEVLVESHKVLNKLGLTERTLAKLDMLIQNLANDEYAVTMETVFNRLIDTAIHKSNLNIELIESGAIGGENNGKGTAHIRIAHFIKMVKEHNSKSDSTFMLTPSLITHGLRDGKNGRKIEVALLKCSDSKVLLNGTGCNRGAVKNYALDNANFVEYNLTLGRNTPRSHFIQSVKDLSL